MAKDNDIKSFWKLINNKKNNTLYDRYKHNDAPEEILNFITLGGGGKLGCISEQYAKYKFNILQKRKEGDTNYDHIIEINNKLIKVEQKTSTNNGKKSKFLWQHIAINHDWNILLLMAIDYTEVNFYGLTKKQFNKLLKDGKITNQGSKDNSSHQGYWFKFNNVKDDLIIINNNEDLIKFIKSNI